MRASPKSSMATEKQKLRILCIHGYRQNAQAFRERTGAFRKLIKKYAELVFIDAPNVVPSQSDKSQDSAEKSSDERGWWFSRQDDYFHAQDDSDCSKGYEASLDVIRKAFTDQGPFDGVLGFSQGASMVSLMCGLQQCTPTDCGFHFDFAILVAGFRSRSAPHNHLYSDTITLPTLQVFGDTDKVISKDMSEELLQYFKSPQVINHPGGHFIPATGIQKPVYNQFLQSMIDSKTVGS